MFLCMCVGEKGLANQSTDLTIDQTWPIGMTAAVNGFQLLFIFFPGKTITSLALSAVCVAILAFIWWKGGTCGKEGGDMKEQSTLKQDKCHEKHEEIISPSQKTPQSLPSRNKS